MKFSESIQFERKLWEHQAAALDRFGSQAQSALLWEMGTGKTTAAIGWLRAKYNTQGVITPTLVLSKVATLWNWHEEFLRNSPPVVASRVQVLYGEGKKKLTGAQRAKLVEDENKSIFIANYDALTLPAVLAAFEKRKIKIVVCDEAQAIKNHQSKRFKSLLKFSDYSDFRMLLTGTPILNSYLDVWAQWRFLEGKGSTRDFPSSFYAFRNLYFYDKNSGMPAERHFPDFKPRPEMVPELIAKMEKKASRITKLECLSLPPIVNEKIHVELNDEQRRLYDQMLNELVSYVRGEEATASNALVKVLRILQITSGHLPLDNGEMVRIQNVPRLGVLREILEEVAPHHKVIVWTVFRESYRDIENLCEEMGLPFATLTGDTKDKQGEIDRFQKDDACRIMISNPKAGGVGVNLTSASYAVYYTRDFSLESRLQSEARNHRGGSEIHEKITLIDIVAKGTLDEDVLAALTKKENMAESVLTKIKALQS